MKITYLGTAAAEGFPAVFCNCEYCREAKRLGGKNIRTRSQALINDDLLIDLPADTYSHFLQNDIRGDAIRYLFVTHSHADHFYEKELHMRHGAYAHDMQEETLFMFGSRGAVEKSRKVEMPSVTCKEMKPFETVCVGDYAVSALPARHFDGDGALIFVICKEGKTLLYAHDTGYFYDEVFAYIKEQGLVFDLVSLDCTNVDISIGDDGSHMGLANIARVLERLKAMGAVTEKTKQVINHFSHNGAPLHHKLEERVRDYGYIVSYDGLCIEV